MDFAITPTQLLLAVFGVLLSVIAFLWRQVWRNIVVPEDGNGRKSYAGEVLGKIYESVEAVRGDVDEIKEEQRGLEQDIQSNGHVLQQQRHALVESESLDEISESDIPKV